MIALLLLAMFTVIPIPIFVYIHSFPFPFQSWSLIPISVGFPFPLGIPFPLGMLFPWSSLAGSNLHCLVKRCKELRERLGVDDIALVLQRNRLRWYGHVLRKDDDDWVKKCIEYEVEGSRPRGRPKKTWKEVVREDCQARKLNKEDAMDRCK